MGDFIPVLTEAFGPAGAVCIAALSFWGWSESRAHRASQEKRIEENRAYSRELFETINTLNEFKAMIMGAQK